MPVLQDRVQETTTTGGTGTLTLAGAVTGYRSFAQAFSIGDITYYTIDNGSGEWEIGVGTVGSGTLSRNSVLESSNANALVNFGSGTKRVFCSAPTKVLLPNETGNSGKLLTTDGVDPAWTSTVNGLTIGNVTPGSGAFTTLSASSTVSGTGFSTYLASPPAIGGTTPAAGAFTTLSSTGNTTLGDASSDTLTINGTAVSAPNGLNVNSNQVVLSGGNFGIGGSPAKLLDVLGSTNRVYVAPDESYGVELRFINRAGSAFANSVFNGTYHAFYASNSETARLTSKGLLVGYTSDSGLSGTGNAIFSGNVGIGTNLPGQQLEVIGNIKASGYVWGATNVYAGDGSVSANAFARAAGVGTGMYFPAADTLGFSTSANERMRIDSSGNLGLGVTPSAWPTGKAFEVGFKGNGLFGRNIAEFYTLQNIYNDGSFRYAAEYPGTAALQYNGTHIWYNTGSATPVQGGVATLIPAMTLDASGNLLIGATSYILGQYGIYLEPSWSATNAAAIGIAHINGTSSGAYYAVFAYNGALIGSITQNGTTAVAYNISSDQRLKTNVKPAESAIQSILDFPVDQFDWISDGSHVNFGAVAQKAVNVIPEMVSVPSDPEEMWGIDWSKAVPRLIRAYQELHAEIELLKAKVN